MLWAANIGPQAQHVLSHATLHRDLRRCVKMARKGDIPCAGARCKGRMISDYLVEEGWGLCGKCHQKTYARCYCLVSRHRGTWEARICPTIIDLTPSDSKPNETPKVVVPQKCSKCDELVPQVNNQTIIPCPCGAIVCRRCTQMLHQKQGLLLFGCWCKEAAPSNSVANEKSSEVVDPTASRTTTTEAVSFNEPQLNTNGSEQVCKGVSVGADLKASEQMALPQPVVFPFQQPQLTQNSQPMQYRRYVQQSQFMQHPQLTRCPQQPPLAQNTQPAQQPHLVQQPLCFNEQYILQYSQNPSLMQQLQTMGQAKVMLQQLLWQQGPVNQH